MTTKQNKKRPTYYGIESTLDFRIAGWRFRVWRNETKLMTTDSLDLQETIIGSAKRRRTDGCLPRLVAMRIVRRLSALDRVTAVQAIDPGGIHGVMVYTVPFCDKEHSPNEQAR